MYLVNWREKLLANKVYLVDRKVFLPVNKVRFHLIVHLRGGYPWIPTWILAKAKGYPPADTDADLDV
jgi:hypothetical protein